MGVKCTSVEILRAVSCLLYSNGNGLDHKSGTGAIKVRFLCIVSAEFSSFGIHSAVG